MSDVPQFIVHTELILVVVVPAGGISMNATLATLTIISLLLTIATLVLQTISTMIIIIMTKIVPLKYIHMFKHEDPYHYIGPVLYLMS